MSDNLFQASLNETDNTNIYSSGALMAAAFFGGGFATVALAGLNSRRIGRLAKDWPWLLLGVLVTIGVLYVVVVHYGSTGASRDGRIANRVAGFGLWIAYYVLHKKHYRAMIHTGAKPPSPIKAVIASVLLGIVLSMATMLAIGFATGTMEL